MTSVDPRKESCTAVHWRLARNKFKMQCTALEMVTLQFEIYLQ